MFWILFFLFVIFSVALTAVILMQEPQQSGLGEGLGGGGQDFSGMRGTAGGLNRLTIWMGIIWGLLALSLSLVSRV